MNVVKSFLTPFHPFGGAVDVIVVQQQDGSFRSTPWYVRFGKFQGVLKGSEKFVRIAVNGTEANFHMYLDNSGEAYFVKEVDHSNGVPEDSDNPEFRSVNGDFQQSENEHLGNVRKLEHSVSDSGVDRLQEESDFLESRRLERAESDGERRFYEFQDDQSSLEDSVELSEYEENVVESQNLDSEVVLVSVDGHILTAPITAAEQNSNKVQFKKPQFHIGPGEEGKYGDDNGELKSGQSPLAVDYVSKVNGGSTENGVTNNISGGKNDEVSELQLEVCEGDGDHFCQASEIRGIEVQSDSEDIKVLEENKELCVENKGNNVKDTSLVLDENHEDIPAEEEDVVEDDRSSLSLSLNNGLLTNEHSDEENRDVEEINGFEEKGIVADRDEDERFEFDVSESIDETCNNSERPMVSMVDIDEKPLTEDEIISSEPMEATTTAYDDLSLPYSNLGFEISLCGNKLQPGMGSEAAAEAFEANRVSSEEFKSCATSILKNGNLVVRYREQYFPWEKVAHIALGIAAFGLELSIEAIDAIPVEHDNAKKDDSGLASTPTGSRWRLFSIPFRRVKTLEHAASNLSNEDEFVDSESVLANSQVETPTSQSRNESPRRQLVRTNVPSSDQIASLNLKDGQNIVTFSFSTRVFGKQEVEAHMYLWKWNARIVISDVDGTITKSDVLGQVMPLVGKDWTQSGVAKLFSAIKENGYQLLFLSARAIVQAYITRSYLVNLKQDGNTLPDGPVVISPDGLFPSLYREVIRRAPHEFKIACLEDIKKLFPSDYNPFYAGFGNRDTDELSYRKIGIPKGKIFIINPKGEVAISHRIDVKSYTSLHTLVNDMFPPTSLVEQEDFNSWNFWKVPLPEIED